MLENQVVPILKFTTNNRQEISIKLFRVPLLLLVLCFNTVSYARRTEALPFNQIISIIVRC